MALLLVELVRRDLDFGPHCFEEFFTDEVADHLRKHKDYEVCIDFVRMMLRKHDAAKKIQAVEGPEKTEGVDPDASG